MDTSTPDSTQFGLDLFHMLNKNDSTSNMFFSPMSISSALKMILMGSKCRTAEQISHVSINRQNIFTHPGLNE